MSGVKGANAGEKHYRYIHGETHTRLHKIWESMIARCEYVKHPFFNCYGGRGISVCDEWHDYMSFRSWAIENGYAENLTIDRINNDMGYAPTNCKWSTVKEQQNNKRSNRHIEWNGEDRTLSEWSEITGINKTTIKERLNAGWDAEKAFTFPVRLRTKGYRMSNAKMNEKEHE